MQNIAAILPFTEEVSEPLFVRVFERLRTLGNPIPEDEMHQIYLECREHIVYATRLFGRFWNKFGEDEIDVNHQSTSFYTLLYQRIRLSIDGMSTETAERNFKLLHLTEHPEIAQATNHFLNAMVRELKRPDPVLAYAAI